MGEFYTPPKMVMKRAVDCLFDVEDDASAYQYVVNYAIPEGQDETFTIFTGDYFIEKLFSLYYNRKVMVREDRPEFTFYKLFEEWRYNRNRAYAKMAYAIAQNYNPVQDYDMTETMTNDQTVHVKGATYRDTYNNNDTKTITPFSKEKIETTPADVKTETTPMETTVTTTPADEKIETTPMETKVTTTPYTSEKTTTTPHDAATTNLTSAFNSGDAWSNSTKSIQSGTTDVELKKTGNEIVNTTHNDTKETVLKTRNDTTETVVTTHNNTKETVHTTSNNTKETVEKTFEGTKTEGVAHSGYVDHTSEGSDTDTRNYTLTRSGSMGPLTAADMIKREYENLMMNLADQAIDEFMDRYTFYAEGGDF